MDKERYKNAKYEIREMADNFVVVAKISDARHFCHSVILYDITKPLPEKIAEYICNALNNMPLDILENNLE
jgi:hypothetical protein